MKANKTAAKYMGYFILSVLAIGGLGFLFVVYQFEREYLDGTKPFVPFLGMATVAVALLWGGVATSIDNRSEQEDE